MTVGANGYTITFCKSTATGNPTDVRRQLMISGTGAYSGMTALQSPYQIDVTAKTATVGEVHLVRTIQAVAIPVFQFGMFSDVGPELLRRRRTSASAAGSTPTATCGWPRAECDADDDRQDHRVQETSSGNSCRTAHRSPRSWRARSAWRRRCRADRESAMAMNQGSVVGMPGSAATTAPVNWSDDLDSGAPGTTTDSSNGPQRDGCEEAEPAAHRLRRRRHQRRPHPPSVHCSVRRRPAPERPRTSTGFCTTSGCSRRRACASCCRTPRRTSEYSGRHGDPAGLARR